MSDPQQQQPTRKNPTRKRAAPIRYDDELVNKETAKRQKVDKHGRTSNDSDDRNQYEVESILESRRTGDLYEFKIKWKGYAESEATWEPEKNLKHCEDMVNEFELEAAKRVGPTKQLKEVIGATTAPGSLHYLLKFTDGTSELVKYTSALAWYERQMMEYFREAEARRNREGSSGRY